MSRRWSAITVLLLVAAASLAAAMMLIHLADSLEGHELAQRSWPVAAGTLSELSISPSGVLDTRSHALGGARYEYGVAGRTYSGRTTSIPSSWGYVQIREAFAPLLIETAALQEHTSRTGTELVYAPRAGQQVSIAYDPADPSDGILLLTPMRTGFMVGARVCGWIMGGIGSLMMIVVLVVRAQERRHAAQQKALRRRWLVGEPDAAEVAAFTAVIDRAIAAVAVAGQGGAAAADWHLQGSGLATLRRDPVRALREQPRLGYVRTIDECGLNDGSPAVAQVLAAIAAMEAVHAAFRAKHRPQD